MSLQLHGDVWWASERVPKLLGLGVHFWLQKWDTTQNVWAARPHVRRASRLCWVSGFFPPGDQSNRDLASFRVEFSQAAVCTAHLYITKLYAVETALIEGHASASGASWKVVPLSGNSSPEGIGGMVAPPLRKYPSQP